MKILLTIAVAVTLMAGPVFAQVVPTQTGQALDANSRVGSGGVNTRGTNARINSQLYVNGQVTGLGGFRGTTGYYADNSVRLALPSDTMDTFRGQSVGLSDAMRGGAYSTSAYYGRSQTAMTAGDIIAGRTMTGTNIPRSGSGNWTSAAAQELMAEATRGYTGLMQIRQEGALDVGSNKTTTITAPDRTMAGLNTGRIRIPEMTREPRAPGVSGLLRDQDSRQLAAELYEAYVVDAAIDGRVKAEVDALPGGSKPPGAEDVESDEKDPDDKLSQGAEAPQANQDVFMNVLLQLRELSRHKQPNKTVEQSEETGAPDASIVKIESGSIVVKTLAGKSRDAFNRHMVRGDWQLRKGKYYDAAMSYKYASIIDSSNPMAQLGLTLSYFAAGEPMTAALQLRQAFVIFPPIMRTKLAVKDIIGEEVLADRLSEVNSQLASRSVRDERSLVFLAVFMHHSANQTQEARRLAQKLKDISKADKMMTAYAVYVLTGKSPGDVAQPPAAPAKPVGPVK